MADLSDVEQALVNLVSQTVYPLGTSQPSAIVYGGTAYPVKVYRGWPTRANLDADLASGTININVFPMDYEMNVTRYDRNWRELPVTPATVTVTVNPDETITVGGAVPVPYAVQNVSVVANGVGVTYTAQATDTPTSIATSLASMLVSAGLSGVTSSGATISVPNSRRVSANVGVMVGTIREVKRQIRTFRIIMWCPDPYSRDAAGTLLDPALAAPIFITMPDGTGARLRSTGAPAPDDDLQKELGYRRDLVYTVEYSTSQTKAQPQVGIVSEVVTVGNSGQQIVNIVG